MLVVAKGPYGLGGNIGVLAAAMHLADQLGCNVAADRRTGMYRVNNANVAELLFEHPSLEKLPDTFGTSRIRPPEWTEQIQLITPTTGAVNGVTLGRITTLMARAYGIAT